MWNTHLIRPSKNINVPSGRPSVMYTFPELYGTRDFLKPIEDASLEICKSQCVFRRAIPCDSDLYELCCIFMAELHLTVPTDPFEAVNLYMQLREAIRAAL